MSATISLTETQCLTALRSLILTIIPGGAASPPTFECIRGLVNRVPEPTSDNYCTMTPLTRIRLATNVETYNDLVTSGFKNSLQSTQMTVQIDFHGPLSGDNAQIFTTLWRDEYSTDYLAQGTFILGNLEVSPGVNLTDQNGNIIQVTGYVDLQPLYSSEPRQIDFINAEDQYEERWSVDAEMQINPIATTPQQFADTLTVTLVNVEETFPI